MRAHSLTFLLLSACLGRSSSKDVGEQLDTGELESELDADGDGWPADEDCDDNDPNVNPGSTETCNNIDDDCDGETDEGVTTTFYADLDVDGYGDAEVTADTCDQPTGYVPTGTDCDDTRDDVYPNAPELCDGVDNDCDGDIDEEDTLSWYPDADADGFGDISADPTESCEGLSGYVLDNTDCDDDEAASFPDNPEVCDELDNDCDGLVDEGVTTTWYTDADADGYGDDLGQEEACSQPSGTAEVGGDCNESDGDINPGAAEICNGIDDDCDSDIDDDDSSLDTTTASTWYADDDTDGYGDATDTTTACDQPSGTVSDATDCDDADGDVNPGETEICNGIDDDCDNDIDDDDSSLDTTTTSEWWPDDDLDGYGDSVGTSVESCDQPSGYEDNEDDCDDSDPDVNPAETESCNGIDDDCDDVADDSSVCPCDVEYYSSDYLNPYMFCSSAQAWTTAQSECDSYGYHMLTIDDATEDSWVDTTADSYSTSKWWFGLNDRDSEGTFTWEDGSSSTYTNWRSGEPNDSNSNEDCAQLNRWTDGTWNDEPCSSSFYYICEAG